MAYLVTARKWRPLLFDEVVGQAHITTTLKNAIDTDRVAQAYLLCGPRGVGKTTSARILAKALNCSQRVGADPCNDCSSCRSITDGTSMNVLEIDGASNNSVEDVRELREVVRYAPTEGAYKIYIIDEVHMLSTAAFNALLKTLEEPPPRVVFVFATTEIQEVPETIVSRCQRFNFRRIPTVQIAQHLQKITSTEGIDAQEEALFLLASRADGALRDATSLLDQVVAFDQKQVRVDTVRQVLGLVDGNVYFELTEAIAAGQSGAVLDKLATVVDEGGDLEEFVYGYIEHVRHILFTKVQQSAQALEVAETEKPRFETLAAELAEEDLLRQLRGLMELSDELKRSLHPRFRVEVTLVRLARMGQSVEIGQLLRRLTQLEEVLKKGEFSAGPAPRPGASSPSAPPATKAAAPQARRPITPSAPSGSSRAHSTGEEPPPPEPPPESSRSFGVGAEPPPPEPPPGPSRSFNNTAAEPPRVESPPESSVETGGGGQEVDFGRIEAEWAQLVGQIRRVQPPLGIFLQSAVLKGGEGNVLKLEFARGDRFPMSQVEKNREVVEKLCAEKWGHPLRLNCVLGGEAVEEKKTKIQAKPQDDPTIKAVLDAFDGELI